MGYSRNRARKISKDSTVKERTMIRIVVCRTSFKFLVYERRRCVLLTIALFCLVIFVK